MSHPAHQTAHEPDSPVWRAIRSHALDDPAAQWPLSKRLQEEQNWSEAQTARLIEEYRRFVYLSQSAGHPVTPSDAVDQVWHQHMLHSHDYWDVWCGQVLGRALHHVPSKGGPAESARCRQQYQQTLMSYERVFGQVAPSDLWPDAVTCFAGRYRRCDLRKHWMLPRPGPWLRRQVATLRGRWCSRGQIGWALLGVPLSGCTLWSDGWLPPVSGPSFLVQYAVLMVLVWLLNLWIEYRWLERDPGTSNPSNHLPDAYQAAYLTDGLDRLTETALATAWQARTLQPGDKDVQAALPLHTQAALDPLARQVALAVERLGPAAKPAQKTEAARAVAKSHLPDLLQGLRERGWIADAQQVERIRRRQASLWLVLGGYGILRVIHGLSNGRPVALLVMLLVIVASAAFIAWRRPVGANAVGRDRVRAARTHLVAPADVGATDPMLPLHLALLGSAGLVASSVAALRQELKAADRANSFGWGGDASDGGGGGGGCGGCGGGGGGGG